MDLGEKGCGLAGPGRVPRLLDQVEVEMATYFAKTKTLGVNGKLVFKEYTGYETFP